MIFVNGKKIIQQNFTLQADNNTQKAAYIIPSLKQQDKIDVEAQCNIAGSLKKSITIGQRGG